VSGLITLVRERGNQLIAAVMVEISELNMGPATTSRVRWRRGPFLREKTSTVSKKNQNLTLTGERNQILVAIAIEIARGQRNRADLSLF
jgi:hypothetical protein